MRKKILCLALAMVLVLSLVPPALAATDTLTFSDVPETHWAYDEIMEMTAQGLFTGKSAAVDGVAQFAPDDTMTRAEFVTVVTRMIFGEELAARENPAGAPWWRKYYDIAVENRILNAGELDGGSLDRPMTRQEMALVIGRAAQGRGLRDEVSALNMDIPDWEKVADAYKPAVLFSYAYGLLTGVDEAGTFDPTGTLNRAAGATVVYRLIEKSAGREGWSAGRITLSASKVEYGIMSHLDYDAEKLTATNAKSEELVYEYCDDPEWNGMYGVGEDGRNRLGITVPGKGSLTMHGYVNTDWNFEGYSTVNLTGLPDYDGDWMEAANEYADTFLSETVSDTIRTNVMAIVRDVQARATDIAVRDAAQDYGSGLWSDFDIWRMNNVGQWIDVGDGCAMYWGTSGLRIETIENISRAGRNKVAIPYEDFAWFDKSNMPS